MESDKSGQKRKRGRPTLAEAASVRRKLMRAYMRGRAEADYPPVSIWIEPTNRCNLRCPMCPQSEGLKREYGFMPLDRFERIIGDAAGLVQICSLHFGGESLLHRDLAEMVRMVSSRGVPCVLHSNGTLMTPEIARMLIEAGLEQIVFSFDAFPRDEYEKKRTPAKFDKTLERIRGFLEEKKRLGGRWPIVTIKSLIFNEPGASVAVPDEIRKLFAGLPVDHFAAEWAHTFAGGFASKVLDERRYGVLGREQAFGCVLPWYGFAVGWDGRVFACCNDLNGECFLGDLNTESIMEVWNGDRIRKLRADLAAKNLKDLSLCATCDAMWRNFDASCVLREGAGYAAKHIVRKSVFRK